MKAIISESIRYWETRRIVYNVSLALFLLAFTLAHHLNYSALSWQQVVELMVMAAVANVLYCAAYIVDIFVQHSDFQEAWKRHRWMLLAAGTLLAMAFFYVDRD